MLDVLVSKILGGPIFGIGQINQIVIESSYPDIFMMDNYINDARDWLLRSYSVSNNLDICLDELP